MKFLKIITFFVFCNAAKHIGPEAKLLQGSNQLRKTSKIFKNVFNIAKLTIIMLIFLMIKLFYILQLNIGAEESAILPPVPRPPPFLWDILQPIPL